MAWIKLSVACCGDYMCPSDESLKSVSDGTEQREDPSRKLCSENRVEKRCWVNLKLKG